MSLNFVNIHGQPVSVAPVKRQAASKAQAGDYHKGYRVVGFAPLRMASAQAEHERLEEAAAKASPHYKPQPWSADAYMARSKPSAVRSKPYELASAAEQCAEMARRSGWLRVEVRPISSAAKAAS